MIYNDDFPAGGHWPGARNFISLAELSGVAPARAGARAARRRPIPDRLSRAPEVLSRPAIDMAAVRDLVDEKRRAMSAAEWAKATEDGAMVARGLRALKTLPDPQAAMPAFRRKMAEVGVTESAIARIPQIWDARLADVVIAAHGEMVKLPGREDASAGADGADEDWPDWMRNRYGDPSEWRVRSVEIENGEGEKHVRLSDAERKRNDWQRYVFALGEKSASGSALTDEEGKILRRERGRMTLSGGSDAHEPELPPTVSPFPGRIPKIRNDKVGNGAFWDRRKRSDGSFYHDEGIDLESVPGETVVSPVMGTVTAFTDPYRKGHPLHGQYNSIWIETDDGKNVVIRYVSEKDMDGKQVTSRGERVDAGSPIGIAQDRAKHQARMINHVHVEVRVGQGRGKPIDPTPWLDQWHSTN